MAHATGLLGQYAQWPEWVSNMHKTPQYRTTRQRLGWSTDPNIVKALILSRCTNVSTQDKAAIADP